MKKHLPPPQSFIGKTLNRFPDYRIVEHVARGNNGRLYRAHNPRTESNLAFKIVPVQNLPESADDQDAYLSEAKKANGLEHPTVVRYLDVFPHTDPTIYFRGIVFVCDYVSGPSLRTYMRTHTSDINLPFIENFLRTIFGLLYELDQRRYSHGDLHAGNILVAKSQFDVDGRTNFRVTDFGVQQFSEKARHESDFLFLSEILRDLLRLIDYRDCDGRDRYAYDVLRNEFLNRHLTETDPSADTFACNPRKLIEKLNSITDTHLAAANTGSATKLVTPFDYPNCEQIGNSHLLLKTLYSDRLLGLSEIRARSNLVLTGPRGCGKTTVFRALSVDYLSKIADDHPDDVRYIGIYYRCDDLYFAFPRYTKPTRHHTIDVPMHFLIVTLLATLLSHFSTWAQRHYSDEYRMRERPLIAKLWRILDLEQPSSPDSDTTASIVSHLKANERKRALSQQRRGGSRRLRQQPLFGPGKMIEACQVIRQHFTFLKDRPIYFFIDDYSDPKITIALQSSLNRLLMYRSADVFFKISTESPVSFSREDIDDKKYVESREYELVHLGLRYLKDESHKRREFIEDLFCRRFSLVPNYPVRTLNALLGNISRNENASARTLRTVRSKDHALPSEREHGYFAGCETVAAMCSGDIHYIIRLVSRMVEDYGGAQQIEKSKTTPKIPVREQSKSIRAAAGEFVESIRTLPDRGPHLANIITAFGNVARSYLLHMTSTNQGAEQPHQASRIEPYEALKLSDEAAAILKELLRYSVLIEDPSGKSRRGKVVPRYYLRRYLIPHFLLTFSRRDSIQLENHQIEMLLCRPEKLEDSMRLKADAEGKGRRAQTEQGAFFRDA